MKRFLHNFGNRVSLNHQVEFDSASLFSNGNRFHRSGLIKARLAGAKAAQGDVMVFLDAHCECSHGWLQPLLARIQESREAVVVPLIDVISAKTFEYQTDGYGFDVTSLLKSF